MADLQIDIPRAENVSTGKNPGLDKSLIIPRAENVSTGINPITPMVLDIPRAENTATGMGLGYDTILNIPRAENVASGIVPPYWMWPPLEVCDDDGNVIGVISLPEIYPGQRTDTKTLTFRNKLPEPVTVTVAGGEAYNGTDKDRDTKDALYLSLDNINFSNTIDITATGYGEVDFYLYYRPPSTALTGSKVFPLQLNYDSSGFELWDYVNYLDVTSTSTTDQTDLNIIVTIPYTSGKMKTDFSDIRFLEYNWFLDYALDSKIDSNYASFIIKIPSLLAGETKRIFVFSGNNTAIDESKELHDENYNWIDGTVYPWVQIEGPGGSYLQCVDWGGHYVLYQRAAFTTAPNTVRIASTKAYGRWTIKFLLDRNTTNKGRYYFIDNTTDYYVIEFNQDTNMMYLYRNTTVLGSASYPGDTTGRILVIDRFLDGTFNIYLDGVLKITATDNTITTSTYMRISQAEWYWISALYTDYIKIMNYDENYPTITSLTTWNNLVHAIPIMGKVTYNIQDLPKLKNGMKYGIRINGVLYE